VDFTPRSKAVLSMYKLAEVLTGERKVSKVKRFLKFIKKSLKTRNHSGTFL
jgi:hypothetical protein